MIEETILFILTVILFAIYASSKIFSFSSSSVYGGVVYVFGMLVFYIISFIIAILDVIYIFSWILSKL